LTKTTDPYYSLETALLDAFRQASKGKGKERHANDKPFEDQPIFWIDEHFKSFQLGQAVKKMHESQGMEPAQAIHELRGSIVYISARIITLQKYQKLIHSDEEKGQG
jgi:hypothetical protein